MGSEPDDTGKTAARAEWIGRVLGVRIPITGGDAAYGFAEAWRAAVESWRDASDLADQQIAALQRALRDNDDDELEEIADYGLNAVTGGHKVPLLAVLRELDPAAPKPGTLDRARTVVEGFRAHLETDERVEACDENPFGVTMTLRKSLVPALSRLQVALRQAG